MRLVYEPVPKKARVAKYERYMPLVREFNESGESSARVESDEPDKVLPARLSPAIRKLGLVADVRVRQSMGSTYLVRIGG